MLIPALVLSGCSSSGSTLRDPANDYGFDMQWAPGEPPMSLGGMNLCTEGEGGLEIIAVRPERISNLSILDIGAHVVRDGMLVGMQPNPDFTKLGVQRLPLTVGSAPCTTIDPGVIEIVLVVHPKQDGSLDGLLVDYRSGRRMRTVRVPFHLKTCKAGTKPGCPQN